MSLEFFPLRYYGTHYLPQGRIQVVTYWCESCEQHHCYVYSTGIKACALEAGSRRNAVLAYLLHRKQVQVCKREISKVLSLRRN
jgi:hypothetical protein